MDDLEGARRMGREGQQAFNLSIQEKNAFDQGRRDRDNAMNWGRQASNDGGGGAGIAALMGLALVAPAFLAPGLALWMTWTYFAETQGWDWPVLAAICVAEGIAFIALIGFLYKVTPAIIAAAVTSLYLGVAYALCMPPLLSTGFVLTAIIAMGTGAAGYLALLNAPNRWMSSLLITSVVAIGLGVCLNLFAVDLMFAAGLSWLAFPMKWAGAGLALGAILRLVFKRTIFVLGVAAVIAACLFLAPGLLGDFANAVTGASVMVYGE
jgi:hypothetical protein